MPGLRQLSAAMVMALTGADTGHAMGVYYGCSGRSEFGGRHRTVIALTRAGLIDHEGNITPAGRVALSNSRGGAISVNG